MSGNGVVTVRRTGGFAGMERSGAIELGSDPRTGEVRELLARIDPAELGTAEPLPDGFVYVFTIHDTELTVAEDQLTPDLERLARIVLGD